MEDLASDGFAIGSQVLDGDTEESAQLQELGLARLEGLTSLKDRGSPLRSPLAPDLEIPHQRLEPIGGRTNWISFGFRSKMWIRLTKANLAIAAVIRILALCIANDCLAASVVLVIGS